MARSRLTFAPPSFMKLLERMNRADLEAGVVDAFTATTAIIQPDLERNIEQHHRTGQTEEALVKQPEIVKEGNLYSVEYGYELKEGIAAIFLEYGTPRMKPTPTLRPAIKGNIWRWRKAQKEAIFKRLK
jgi:HK97 gp10 family phage protein